MEDNRTLGWVEAGTAGSQAWGVGVDVCLVGLALVPPACCPGPCTRLGRAPAASNAGEFPALPWPLSWAPLEVGLRRHLSFWKVRKQEAQGGAAPEAGRIRGEGAHGDRPCQGHASDERHRSPPPRPAPGRATAHQGHSEAPLVSAGLSTRPPRTGGQAAAAQRGLKAWRLVRAGGEDLDVSSGEPGTQSGPGEPQEFRWPNKDRGLQSRFPLIVFPTERSSVVFSFRLHLQGPPSRQTDHLAPEVRLLGHSCLGSPTSRGSPCTPSGRG